MIDQALKDWLAFITGLKVVKVPYANNRPENNYVSYQVSSIIPTEHARKNVYSNPVGNVYSWASVSSATMTVSVNIYSADGAMLFAKIGKAGDWWEAKQKLTAEEKMAFNPPIAVRNLTALGEEHFRPRWQSDLRFYVDVTEERTQYAIREWHLTGQFRHYKDDPNPINSKINFPE